MDALTLLSDSIFHDVDSNWRQVYILRGLSQGGVGNEIENCWKFLFFNRVQENNVKDLEYLITIDLQFDRYADKVQLPVAALRL